MNRNNSREDSGEDFNRDLPDEMHMHKNDRTLQLMEKVLGDGNNGAPQRNQGSNH